MRERILITGPGGRVGTQIVPLLREHFALRLLDTQPLTADGDDEFRTSTPERTRAFENTDELLAGGAR